MLPPPLAPEDDDICHGVFDGVLVWGVAGQNLLPLIGLGRNVLCSLRLHGLLEMQISVQESRHVEAMELKA